MVPSGVESNDIGTLVQTSSPTEESVSRAGSNVLSILRSLPLRGLGDVDAEASEPSTQLSRSSNCATPTTVCHPSALTTRIYPHNLRSTPAERAVQTGRRAAPTAISTTLPYHTASTDADSTVATSVGQVAVIHNTATPFHEMQDIRLRRSLSDPDQRSLMGMSMFPARYTGSSLGPSGPLWASFGLRVYMGSECTVVRVMREWDDEDLLCELAAAHGELRRKLGGVVLSMLPLKAVRYVCSSVCTLSILYSPPVGAPVATSFLYAPALASLPSVCGLTPALTAPYHRSTPR